MQPLTYSLQFRGQTTPIDGGIRKHGRAPGCAIVTSLAPAGLETRYVWSHDEVEAVLESTLAYCTRGTFVEEGTVFFVPGHAIHIRGRGQLEPSPDPSLRHGTVVWEIVGGTGGLEGARGRITSNLLLSDTGDLTESQLGVIFRSIDTCPTRRTGAGTRDLPGASGSLLARPSRRPQDDRSAPGSSLGAGVDTT